MRSRFYKVYYTHKGCRHVKPTLSILQLQVTSCQMSVDQSRLPTAQTSQNTLQSTKRQTEQERKYSFSSLLSPTCESYVLVLTR